MKANISKYIRGIFSRFFSKKINIFIGALFLFILFIVLIKSNNSKSLFEIGEVSKNDVISIVSVTGRVVPYRKADLGFDRGGVISIVNAKVGDVVKEGGLLLSIDTSETSAELDSRQAILRDVENGIRVEERTVESTKVKDREIKLSQEREEVIVAMREAHIESEGIIRSNINSFFDNPSSVNPTINVRVSNIDRQKKINNQRLEMTELLTSWKVNLANIDNNSSVQEIKEKIAISTQNQKNIKEFLDEMSSIVSNLSPENSAFAQDTINSYLITINTAQNEMITSISDLLVAEREYKEAITALELAQNEYVLRDAGEGVDVIESERAKVREVGARLSKLQIFSPMDGIVTKIDVERGEIVNTGEIVAGVMSDEVFKIEVNLPEGDISKVNVGNISRVTLDSYGDDISFPAIVTAIDPAETFVEGVPTYKVTLRFEEKDARIRSGMTANVFIETIRKEDVVSIPSASIIKKENTHIVRIPKGDKNFVEKEIRVGVKGSNGYTEILEGLIVGEKIVTFLNK